MNKKLLLYIPLVVALISLAGVVFYTGALMVIQHDTGNDVAKMSTKSIESALEFAFDDSVKGIPGESLIVSQKNNIIKADNSDPVVFKATFTVEEADKSCISSIDLKNSEIEGLIKDPSSTDTVITYYGTITETSGVTKNLGNLYAEFKTLGNELSNDTFKIKAEYTACQKDEKAVKEILGFDAAGIYAHLVK